MPGMCSVVQNLANNTSNQNETGSDQTDIDLQKLAEKIFEKLRSELEIENERLGRSWDR